VKLRVSRNHDGDILIVDDDSAAVVDFGRLPGYREMLPLLVDQVLRSSGHRLYVLHPEDPYIRDLPEKSLVVLERSARRFAEEARAGLLQDEPGSGARGLSKALAATPGAQLHAREAAQALLPDSLSDIAVPQRDASHG
jgi:hypothetical protein